MSGGDIKVLHQVSDGRKVHIDIFVAFYVPDKDGEPVFYQLGNRSGRLRREAILPVSTINLHGYDFPAPAEPEEMLAAAVDVLDPLGRNHHRLAVVHLERGVDDRPSAGLDGHGITASIRKALGR